MKVQRQNSITKYLVINKVNKTNLLEKNNLNSSGKNFKSN